MANRKKILHISKYYPPNRGGIEQIAYHIVSGLKNDYDQMVICFNHKKGTTKDTYEGVVIHRIGFRLKISSQAISIRYFFILRKTIEKYDPDIIYIHLPNPLITLYLLMANIKNRKIIIHWHSDIVDQKFLKLFYNPIQNIILRRANLIFATSEEYKNYSKDLKKYLNKVKVIPNVVDPGRFVYTEDNKVNIEIIKEKYKYKKILLFVGRHVPYKGLEYLIKVSDLINEDAMILIAGDGPLTNKIKLQAKGKKNIEFLGRLSEDELKEYLGCAYIFLFPSITRNEAFGLALAEALYCGVPAVGFCIPGSGVNWVNKDGYTGFMVENRNYVEFAKKVNFLLENRGVRDTMARNAKKWVSENFMYEDMIKKVKQEIALILS